MRGNQGCHRNIDDLSIKKKYIDYRHNVTCLQDKMLRNIECM